MDHIRMLKRIGACDAAVTYASDFETLDQAWQSCERGDWMLWLIGKTIKSKPWTDERKPLLACALDCAESAKQLWPATQKAAIKEAVAALYQWIEGGATVEAAKGARQRLAAADADAAYAAAAAAYAAAAAAAAAAAYAADAAAAADAAYTAARKKADKDCADIVRKHYPNPPEI